MGFQRVGTVASVGFRQALRAVRAGAVRLPNVAHDFGASRARFDELDKASRAIKKELARLVKENAKDATQRVIEEARVRVPQTKANNGLGRSNNVKSETRQPVRNEKNVAKKNQGSGGSSGVKKGKTSVVLVPANSVEKDPRAGFFDLALASLEKVSEASGVNNISLVTGLDVHDLESIIPNIQTNRIIKFGEVVTNNKDLCRMLVYEFGKKFNVEMPAGVELNVMDMMNVIGELSFDEILYVSVKYYAARGEVVDSKKILADVRNLKGLMTEEEKNEVDNLIDGCLEYPHSLKLNRVDSVEDLARKIFSPDSEPAIHIVPSPPRDFMKKVNEAYNANIENIFNSDYYDGEKPVLTHPKNIVVIGLQGDNFQQASDNQVLADEGDYAKYYHDQDWGGPHKYPLVPVLRTRVYDVRNAIETHQNIMPNVVMTRAMEDRMKKAQELNPSLVVGYPEEQRLDNDRDPNYRG